MERIKSVKWNLTHKFYKYYWRAKEFFFQANFSLNSLCTRDLVHSSLTDPVHDSHREYRTLTTWGSQLAQFPTWLQACKPFSSRVNGWKSPRHVPWKLLQARSHSCFYKWHSRFAWVCNPWFTIQHLKARLHPQRCNQSSTSWAPHKIFQTMTVSYYLMDAKVGHLGVSFCLSCCAVIFLDGKNSRNEGKGCAVIP